MRVLDEKQVFQIYYDFSETVANMQGYRTLALNRGEKLGILKIGFEHATDRILSFFSVRFKVKNDYIDEVIQQSVKKKSLTSYRAPNPYRINRKGRRRTLFNSSQKTFEIFSLLHLLKGEWSLDLTLLSYRCQACSR